MSKTPTPDAETQMVHMRLESGLLKRIEDFRFRNRFQTRTEAIRWLIGWALEQKPKPPAEG